ncbi:MAG: hypothetical protein R3Y54_10245 [Eubacteriales bacterium]
MAFIEYLKIEDCLLPTPTSYDVSLVDKESDSSGETEAGTIQRDLVRMGVVTIVVRFDVSAKWLQAFTMYSKMPSLVVEYFAPDELALKKTQMYMVGYQAKLSHDTSKLGLWSVSFSLQEF